MTIEEKEIFVQLKGWFFFVDEYLHDDIIAPYDGIPVFIPHYLDEAYNHELGMQCPCNEYIDKDGNFDSKKFRRIEQKINMKGRL